MAWLRLSFLFWLALYALSLAQPADAADAHVAVARLRGTINPAAASYVERALATAEESGAVLFVLQLDTPGGLDTSMRQIIQRILASPVPVAVYVAPPGARAASAGMYITISAHVAAMAPNTNIGSATPVAMGQGGEQVMSDDMRNKAVNDAVAYARSLALSRERNADWVEQAVREAVNAPAEEALRLGVIDYVAPDLPSLLRAIDGKRVSTVRGPVDLYVADLPTRSIDMQPHEGLLHAITDPTIAYLLLSLGSLALIYELANPGAIVPGVVGGICLLLALYALGTLPVNLAGVLLIVFAMLLFVLELVTPSHGALTVGAIISFVLGSMLLYNTPEGATYLAIAPQAIILVTIFLALFFGVVLGTVVKSHRRRAVTGREGLIGAHGEVREALDPDGMVFVQGELWSATSVGDPIPVGTTVEVVGVEGLRLYVKPAVVRVGPYPGAAGSPTG